MTDELHARVTRCLHHRKDIAALFARYGLDLVHIADEDKIPGSFWGEPEAGLVGNRLYVRDNTPVHSAFHEACHFICMDEQRRATLDTDAGGSIEEENGVCYLQILLADHLPGYDRDRMMQDMDAWGYSFRLGSSRAWFEQDADDARQWLLEAGIIGPHEQPSWKRFSQQDNT
ncbi:MAG: hypothetical protein P8Z31_10575 [Gammaproteobacteria bacterium]